MSDLRPRDPQKKAGTEARRGRLNFTRRRTEVKRDVAIPLTGSLDFLDRQIANGVTTTLTLPDPELDRIRTRVREPTDRWKLLPRGETLELVFS